MLRAPGSRRSAVCHWPRRWLTRLSGPDSPGTSLIVGKPRSLAAGPPRDFVLVQDGTRHRSGAGGRGEEHLAVDEVLSESWPSGVALTLLWRRDPNGPPPAAFHAAVIASSASPKGEADATEANNAAHPTAVASANRHRIACPTTVLGRSSALPSHLLAIAPPAVRAKSYRRPYGTDMPSTSRCCRHASCVALRSFKFAFCN